MDTQVHVQLATNAVATSIASMSRTDIEYGLPWRWTPPRVRKAIADSRTNVAVVYENSLLAAFGIMEYYEVTAHLTLLGVHSSLRRQGLGSVVLIWLEQVAYVAGITRFRLEARADNPAALAFYAKHGYQQKRKVIGYYGGLVDSILLEK